jgi:hypothetical protein
MTDRVVFWHCIGGPSDERFLRSALSVLHDWLQDSVSAMVEFRQLDSALSPTLIQIHASHEDEDLREELDKFSMEVLRCDPQQTRHRPGLFIYCPGDTKVQYAADAEGMLGCSVKGAWGAAWEGNDARLIWHEALHVLWLSDCYDLPRQKCLNDDRCLMQFVFTPIVGSDSPFLCGPQLAKLRSRFHN